MASGRVYNASFSAVSVSAQQDLIALAVAAGKPIEILEFGISQVTRVGDANEVELALVFKSGATTVGSGGGTMTPVARNLSDTPAGAVARINDTTIASGGTIVTDETWYWNVRLPFQRVFTPDTTKIIGANRGVFGLVTTPPAAITMSGYVLFKEFG